MQEEEEEADLLQGQGGREEHERCVRDARYANTSLILT